VKWGREKLTRSSSQPASTYYRTSSNYCTPASFIPSLACSCLGSLSCNILLSLPNHLSWDRDLSKCGGSSLLFISCRIGEEKPPSAWSYPGKFLNIRTNLKMKTFFHTNLIRKKGEILVKIFFLKSTLYIHLEIFCLNIRADLSYSPPKKKNSVFLSYSYGLPSFYFEIPALPSFDPSPTKTCIFANVIFQKLSKIVDWNGTKTHWKPKAYFILGFSMTSWLFKSSINIGSRQSNFEQVIRLSCAPCW